MTSDSPSAARAAPFDLVTIGDGLVGGSATIRYGIFNQGAQEFRIALPAVAGLLLLAALWQGWNGWQRCCGGSGVHPLPQSMLPGLRNCRPGIRFLTSA